MKRVLSYTHNTIQPRQQGNRPTDTEQAQKNHDDRVVAEYRVGMKLIFRLPLQSAAVQCSAWWTLPCSETRRQRRSATRKWSERSRRQEGKWDKIWLTQVVSLRCSIFCNKEKHQQAVSSDDVLNDKPRTMCDAIQLKPRKATKHLPHTQVTQKQANKNKDKL